MSPFEVYAWTTAGVGISFILPPLLRAAGVSSRTDPTASVGSLWPRLRMIVTGRAAATAALSLLLALLVVALLGDEIGTWSVALTSGLGWQSILARTIAPGT
jgi:hypothetical protein